MKTEQRISSLIPFRGHDLCWLLMGIGTDGTRYFYGIFDILLTISVTITYPLHLMIGLFLTESRQETFANLVINLAILACSIKFFTFRLKIKQMVRVKAILRQLDERVRDADEQLYFRRVMLRRANIIVYAFAVLYTSTVAASMWSFLMAEEPRLLYPAWLPFDWKTSRSHFIYAGCYQCLGLIAELAQNLSNDVYAPLTLSLLAGHTHLLKIRVMKIGYDTKRSEAEHNQELVECIRDYNRLMHIYKIIEDIVSLALFTQFLCGGLSIGVTVIYIVLYADNTYAILYYVLQLSAFFGELFPFCYYGSLVVSEFLELPYAIFSCNWLEKQRHFRRNLMIFVELSLRIITAYAGGMIRIHIDSFFATCKMAYSFFAVMITMK